MVSKVVFGHFCGSAILTVELKDFFGACVGAGEDFFRKRRGGYYQGAMGCLILFDKGESETFITVTDWYKEFTDRVGVKTVPIAMIGIKAGKEEITKKRVNN